jgi:hypothetical protein
MAKIFEEIIIIKISSLLKDDANPEPVATPEIVSALAQVAEELAGAGAVVEAEQA